MTTGDNSTPEAQGFEADTAQHRVFEVLPEHAGHRLDRFLVEVEPELSRARVRAMLEAGQVRVNGRRARKGDALVVGAKVELLAPPPPKDFSPTPEAGESLELRREDPLFVVVEKPAGMPTHGLRPEETGTLANRIIARFPETASVGFSKREPGLVHRLDTDTSGLVLVARNQEAFEHLRGAAQRGEMEKKYLCLVEGHVVAEGRVDYPLVPHRKDPKRVEAVTPHVRLRAGTRTWQAQTRYKPLEHFRLGEAELTWVEVSLSTAFRHQVRVHLASVGHPLVGDMLYRGPALDASWGLSRHVLHASELRFPHPSSGTEVLVRGPLPPDLATVLERLRRVRDESSAES